MTIVVIDGIGGGIGAQIVARLKAENLPDAVIVALGANAVATQRMVEAGAHRGASGENAVRVTVGSADYIFGPLGIMLPNAMMGEITPTMAEAVFCAPGKKLLLPLSQPHAIIVGIAARNVSDLISEAVETLKRMVAARPA